MVTLRYLRSTDTVRFLAQIRDSAGSITNAQASLLILPPPPGTLVAGVRNAVAMAAGIFTKEKHIRVQWVQDSDSRGHVPV